MPDAIMVGWLIVYGTIVTTVAWAIVELLRARE